MRTQLPYQAKTLPRSKKLIGIPVKGFTVVVTSEDFADFLAAVKAVALGATLSPVGVFPNDNKYVMVRQDPNGGDGGRIYVMFFRALVVPGDVPLEKISEPLFNLANDSIALHEVRGGKLSTKISLLEHKSRAVVSSMKKLSVMG